uniref:Tektin n=1 Tax=Lygus hesperus TaxID=30085 RepID=A0A0A9X932_LYGHE
MNTAPDRTKLTEYALIGMPTRPMRFNVNHWHMANVEAYRNITAQQKLADRILAEADRIIDQTEDNTLKHKLEVDHQLDVKIKDIEFRKEQLEWQKKQLDEEIDCLKVYMMRVVDAQKNLGHKALDICRKCIVLREGRIGIDLCKDEVDVELEHEEMMIKAVQRMLIRIKEQVKEQMRRLRAMVYSIVRDLEDKSNVLSIDKHNLSLNEKNTCLAIYHGSLPLDPATITQEEWAAHTAAAIEQADKELASGRPLRAYIDVILKQIIDDLWRQYDTVNSA